MNANSNDRILRFLQASPQQQEAIDRILAGQPDSASDGPMGPLLLGMGEAADFLGVSRTTLWRLVRSSRLPRVEVLPGFFQVRRTDLLKLAQGNA